MGLFILDTDTFTHYRHRLPAVCNRIASKQPDEVALSAITIDEALSGWFTYLRKARKALEIGAAYRELIDTVRCFTDFDFFNFDPAAIDRYEILKKLKLNIGGNDLRIAAIALENNATVVRANLRDFTRVPGLKAEDWTQ